MTDREWATVVLLWSALVLAALYWVAVVLQIPVAWPWEPLP